MKLAKIIAATLLTIAATLDLAGTANASSTPASYFGIHYAAAAKGTWPQAHVGSIRLWDTGTMWRDIEPQRDVWDFTLLDAAVANAQAHGATVSLVLGQTPAWASSQPDRWAYYGNGLSAPPVGDADWWTYVHTVAARYSGRIESYEVWNEPNASDLFWAGSTTRLARLAKVARHAVKTADPAALMVSPSPVLRATYGDPFLKAYAKAGGFRWADVIGVHAYPGQGVTVEQAMTNYDRVRALLRSHGVTKPIWDTETNMSTNTGVWPTMSHREQSAQVARYYLLAWSHGVQRVGWYDWSATENLGVRLAAATGSLRPSAAGRTFDVVRGWMQGHRVACSSNLRGVYSCRISGVGVVKWHPGGKVRVHAGSHRAVNVNGHAHRVGRSTKVGDSPVLFRA